MLIGSGARCGRVEVDVCREGSVARGFDRETRWKRLGRRERAAAAPRPRDDGATASCLPGGEQWPQERGGGEGGVGEPARRAGGSQQGGRRTTNQRSANFSGHCNTGNLPACLIV